MDTKPLKTPPVIPVSKVEYSVRRTNEKELRRILGRDLIDVERDKKTRR